LFSLNVKGNIVDFYITHINTAVFCQSECACLHETVNMAVILYN